MAGSIDWRQRDLSRNCRSNVSERESTERKMDNFTQDEEDWFSALGVLKLNEIYDSVRTAPEADGICHGLLHCYSVAQSAALNAGGFLEYHEGTAIHKIGQKRVRHAWNIFHGEIIDLMWPPSMYKDHQSEKSYTFDEVKTAVSKRGEIWDWLSDPEREQMAKLKARTES
jgi:hypothetical protein